MTKDGLSVVEEIRSKVAAKEVCSVAKQTVVIGEHCQRSPNQYRSGKGSSNS